MATPPEDGPKSAGGATVAWERLYDGIGYVGGAVLAIMAFSVFVQVGLRFLGRTGIDGLEEVPRFLFVWLVMLGAAAAMWRNEHTILDYFINLLPASARALVIVLTNAVGIAVFLYLIKLSVILVPNAQLQTSAGLNLPLGYVFAAVPVGSALIILPMFRNIYRALKGSWLKPS